jgi:hypothetical protein
MDVLTGSEEELEQSIAAGGSRGEIYQGLKSIRDRYADLIRLTSVLLKVCPRSERASLFHT